MSATAQEVAALDRTWSRRPGLRGWLSTTNHKEIALRYVVTAFVFFLCAGVLALAMRLQLARPENNVLGPDRYNQFFTVHGSAMMFLFAVPVWEALGLYFVPLMIGTRNVAFPRMNAVGYWLFLFGGLVLFGGLILDIGADAGWFAYVPLAGPQYGAGKRVDFWAQMITFTELSGLIGAVEIITTVFKQRAPGMTLNRIPPFVWAMVVTAFMILFAMPAIMLASTMLAMDRMVHVSTHFFNPAEGGDVLLYQHLFWFFGHPEVYIIFLPATGMVSTLASTFAKRPLFGYTAVVLSVVATAFMGFGLWVHHMFATPIPELGRSFFTAASLMIAVPTGVQMFCWLATLWGGRPRFELPLAWLLGFLAIFVVGGLTGVMLAAVPIDLQVHDTYFVVAHLHYVLIGGSLFPLFGACYYWFPKWTGRRLGTRLGWWNFWLMFVGFNVTFFPMHLLGLHGMPRRVYTYAANTGWTDLNLTASWGAALLGFSVLLFVINVLRSRKRGEPASSNPWDAGTLEWAAASPPAPYNFARVPAVASMNPLWDEDFPSAEVAGLALDHREVLITDTVHAHPQHRFDLATDSLWPFVTSVVVGGSLLGVIFHPIAFPLGCAGAAVCLAGWFWRGPDPDLHQND